MTEITKILAAPFVACLILTGIHCYLGIHIVTRGVIFVDLALAQIAALGSLIACWMGYEFKSNETFLFSLLFTFVGAGIFALARYYEEMVPLEAIIGIIYAVSSALAVLVVSKMAHGAEEIKQMLVGTLLFVSWPEVSKIFIIYLVIGVFHWIFRQKFILISFDPQKAIAKGILIHLWDFLFYVSFGIVVTSSVQIAGVLLVFSYLVVPAVCAMLFVRGLIARLILGWILGFLASVLGLFLSAQFDLPTGASVISAFGLLFILLTLLKIIWKTR